MDACGQPLTTSLQVLAATLALGFLYAYFTKERPYPEFPIATVEGKLPKESWLHYGSQTLTEGLRKVAHPKSVQHSARFASNMLSSILAPFKS